MAARLIQGRRNTGRPYDQAAKATTHNGAKGNIAISFTEGTPRSLCSKQGRRWWWSSATWLGRGGQGTGSEELTEAQKEKKKRHKEAKPANSSAPHEAAPVGLEKSAALGTDPDDASALDPGAVRGRVQPGAQKQPAAAAGNFGSSPVPVSVPPAGDGDGLKPTE